ncbi:MAG: RluA family pseudouridine synthase [Epsilonproteobacteria bacterium]|nr:RluA family pseudouridine synthase [Campylobacterota bacterium]NPA64809.1 RluA family pseudouridine synthase [Campylobacterota bacterium]
MNQSRSQIERLIKGGYVKIDGKSITKPGYKVRSLERVEVELPTPKPTEPKEVDFEVEKLYEDEDILVINKPAGVVVHPAPSVQEPTLVDWLKQENIILSTISGEERHGIVHRLDKETSGVMVVAKNNDAHQRLSAQLQDKSMGRYYLALITPPLKEDIIVDRPIARNPKNRLKMAIVEGGREAKSAFKKILESKNGKTELIAAKLFTGRTHQIRTHLASLHRHILGDSLYGFKSKKDTIPRVFLHAYVLYLIHPRRAQAMRFVAPLPEDMRSYIQKHFDMERFDEKIDPDSIDKQFDFSSGMWRTAKTGQAKG